MVRVRLVAAVAAKSAIEIDSSIWREEIGNRNRNRPKSTHLKDRGVDPVNQMYLLWLLHRSKKKKLQIIEYLKSHIW